MLTVPRPIPDNIERGGQERDQRLWEPIRCDRDGCIVCGIVHKVC
jgi:hypothetical protein